MNPTDAYRKEIRKKELKRVCFFTISFLLFIIFSTLWPNLRLVCFNQLIEIVNVSVYIVNLKYSNRFLFLKFLYYRSYYDGMKQALIIEFSALLKVGFLLLFCFYRIRKKGRRWGRWGSWRRILISWRSRLITWKWWVSRAFSCKEMEFQFHLFCIAVSIMFATFVFNPNASN